jgi:hypothetical protein
MVRAEVATSSLSQEETMQDLARVLRTFRSTALLAASAAMAACDSGSLTQPAQPNLASALAQPAIQSTIEPYTFQLDCQEFGLPYVIQEDGTVKTVSQLFLDNSGNPLRSMDEVQVISTITNLQTGNTYRDYAGIRLEFDFTTNMLTINGGISHITAPGEGIVLQDVGTARFNFDTGEFLFVAGPHNNSGLNYCLAVQ